jgi:hypothetical protein
MRKSKFLALGKVTLIAMVMSTSLNSAYSQANLQVSAQRALITLNATPPAGTKAVRYFIDDMQFSEITDLYAVKTNTTPVWKTLLDPNWLTAGEHTLRIEADTDNGKQIIETKKIKGTHINTAQKLSLNGEWSFAEASDLPAGVLEGTTPTAVQPGYTQGTWTKVFVPNSIGAVSNKWNIYEGILGMYRRNVNISNLTKGEQLFITLHSVYWSGRVFINGIEVGETHGGYLPSRFNITEAIKQGNNEVAVIIDTRFSTRGAFKRLNEFYWNWGGLDQEVEIEKHPAVSMTDLRAEGSMSGTLRLQVTGLNATSSAQKKPITVEVYNASNKKVLGPVMASVDVRAGENIIKLNDIQVANPVLWNLEKPYLYTVIVKGDFGTLTERTGFRDVKVQGRDVVINGKVVEDLQGFDRHADYPGLGRTQPAGLAYQELKLYRDKGFRFFRPAHYPTTPAQLDAADELGLLVIEEINVTGLKGAVLASKEVMDFGAQQIRKMIERDRSHPSIIAWSVGNENLTEEDGAEEYVNYVISLGRSLDPKRLYTQVTHRHTNDRTFKYQDIVAQNYYAGWYAKDVNVIGNMLDVIQAYAGNKPIILSEYGAEAVPGKAGTEKSTEFYQGFVVDAHNRILNNKPHFFGKMYWCSTDFWCRPNWSGGSPAPIPPFHVKSLISYNREHKKLAWRVMFSPVRLIFNPHTVKNTELGGYVEIPADTLTTIKQVITVKEVRGQAVKGKLVLDLPKGFTTKTKEIPFQLQPNQNKSITVTFDGILSSADKTLDCFVKAIIDDDTEAQPLLLTLNIAPEKKK